MRNLILMLIIMGISFAFLVQKQVTRAFIYISLAIIGGILLFVSFDSASHGDNGPALGVGAFVVTFLVIFAFRRGSKK